jgi:hypothetical protein
MKNNIIIQNLINRWNKLHFKISLFIAVMLIMCLPSSSVGEGILKYEYGFPINVITIYQQRETSNWFFYNFFCGNAGILFNPLSIIVNAIIIYVIVFNFRRILKK